MSSGARTVFLLPGQGAQHPRMAADLYGVNKVFTATMDEAFAVLEDTALREIWLRADPGPMLHDITHAQPLLLSVDYALARTVAAAGVHPDAVLGHSVGEIAGAVVAGVFDFADALMLVAALVRTYRYAPAGGMLAVAGSPEAVRDRLTGVPDVVVGVINGPRQVLVCGSRSGLAAAHRRLLADGFTCADVKALQPFHSPLLNDLSDRSDGTLPDPHPAIRPRAPRTPMYSGYLGGPLDTAHATDLQFWLSQPSSPVFFGSALRAVLADGPCTLVETGPGQSLTALARRTPAVARGESRCLAVMPPRRLAPRADTAALAATLDRLSHFITELSTRKD